MQPCTAIPAHLFVSSCDGALHDTREQDWHKKPLRQRFRFHHTAIHTMTEFKATLRAGAWPGGYPLYLICSDGAALCFKCARKEVRNILEAIDRKDGSGWRVVACDINYEDCDLHCEHCSKPIESAYCTER